MKTVDNETDNKSCICQKDIDGLIQQFKQIITGEKIDSTLGGNKIKPEQQTITIHTLNDNTTIKNNSSESHYFTTGTFDDSDLFNYNKESFENNEITLPRDIIVQVYFFGLAGICIYILYNIMKKSK
jgi:hypothetical protein